MESSGFGKYKETNPMYYRWFAQGSNNYLLYVLTYSIFRSVNICRSTSTPPQQHAYHLHLWCTLQHLCWSIAISKFRAILQRQRSILFKPKYALPQSLYFILFTARSFMHNRSKTFKGIKRHVTSLTCSCHVSEMHAVQIVKFCTIFLCKKEFQANLHTCHLLLTVQLIHAVCERPI